MANSARIDELRKKFDENPRRYFAPLANEYRKSGDLDQAAFILEEYLPQQPGHMSGHIVYGQTLFELGRDEEAKRVFETALTLDPENLIALRHLGHIARQAGDFEAARTWYQRLLEADPRDAEIQQLLESLDSAAQARAETLHSEAPPVPTPEPASYDDTSGSLQVEHFAEQDVPMAARTETHPLAPPPLPTTAGHSESEPEVHAIADAPAEHSEELLDLDDFSLGDSSAAEPAPVEQPEHASAPAEDYSADAHPSSAGEGLAFVGLDDISLDEPTPGASETSVEAKAEPVGDEAGHEVGAHAAGNEEPSAYETLAGLDSYEQGLASESGEPKNLDGLETYTFESPSESAGDSSEDVGSFFMEDAADQEHAATPPAAEAAVGAGHVDVEPEEGIPAAMSAAPSEPAPAESSTPQSAPAVAAAAPTPFAGTPSVLPADAQQSDNDAFATETMAKLYLSQGHLESALGIYRTLAAKRPDDGELRRQVEELEDRVQRRRREPTPSAPVDAIAESSASTAEPEPVVVAPGPTMREFLVGLIRRGAGHPSSAGNQSGAESGSLDALFGSPVALDDDLVAADTLATAFASEPMTDPTAGRPTREASSELSLDAVFRQPTARGTDDPSGGFSFDQFFAGDLGDDVAGDKAPAQGEAEDIEQFNAWLNGLKRS